MKNHVGELRVFSCFLSVVLVLLLASPAWAQEVSPGLLKIAIEAYQQQREQPELLPRAKVDPKLVGKKVKVHCRDGRIYEGKLVELTRELLRIDGNGRLETVSLGEVSSVSGQPGWGIGRTGWIAIGVGVGVGLVLMIGERIDDRG